MQCLTEEQSSLQPFLRAGRKAREPTWGEQHQVTLQPSSTLLRNQGHPRIFPIPSVIQTPGVPGGSGPLSQEGRPLGNHHLLTKACKSSPQYLREEMSYVTGPPSWLHMPRWELQWANWMEEDRGKDFDQRNEYPLLLLEGSGISLEGGSDAWEGLGEPLCNYQHESYYEINSQGSPQEDWAAKRSVRVHAWAWTERAAQCQRRSKHGFRPFWGFPSPDKEFNFPPQDGKIQQRIGCSGHWSRAATMWRQGLLPSAAALGPVTARNVGSWRALGLLTSMGFPTMNPVLTDLQLGLSALCAVTAPRSHTKERRGWQKGISMT